MKKLTAVLICLGLFHVHPATASASITQLGIAIDGSGSLPASAFSQIRTGISSALGNFVPADGSIELSIVQFSTTAQTEFAPTVISGPADIVAAQAAVLGMTQLNGATNYQAAIELMNSLIMNSPNYDPDCFQVMNFVTDGAPNVGQTNPNILRDLADNVFDELDAEGVDINAAGQDVLLQLVFPQPGILSPPDELGPGFVRIVANTDDFAAAFEEKIRFLVEPDVVPEPSSLVIFAGLAFCFGAAGWWRRSKAA